MAKNHGSQIKDDDQYEALRDKGISRNKAARIANSNPQSGSSNKAARCAGPEYGRRAPGDGAGARGRRRPWPAG